PARPQRRPQTQPRPAHDPRHPQTLTPRHDRLHRTTPARRQDPTRSQPLPQALPRPQPLPTPRTRTATGDLTNIEATLAQGTSLSSEIGWVALACIRHSRVITLARFGLGEKEFL